MSDIISRQQAIDALRMDIDIIPYAKAREYARAVIETVYNRLENLPSAQPERMRGHWIEIQAPDSDGNGLYECSVCHSGEVHVPIVEVPFCWHCGADMREG